MNLRKDHYRFTNFSRFAKHPVARQKTQSEEGPLRSPRFQLFEVGGFFGSVGVPGPGTGDKVLRGRARSAVPRADREVQRAAPRLPALVGRGRPDLPRFVVFSLCTVREVSKSSGLSSRRRPWPRQLPRALGAKLLFLWGRLKTLSGGSLGSRVDEERSQLRELM